jgi:hypothetical protein
VIAFAFLLVFIIGAVSGKENPMACVPGRLMAIGFAGFIISAFGT